MIEFVILSCFKFEIEEFCKKFESKNLFLSDFNLFL